MKKRIVAILLILLVTQLCGCGFTITKPEEVASDFFQALKTKDEDVLILYTKNEDINLLLHSRGDAADLKLLYESLFKNFTYKIVSAKENKDQTGAVVKVKVSNSDFSKVLEAYQKDAYRYMQENLYSGKADKKKLSGKCMNLFAKQVENASRAKDKKTETIRISLKKNDNYGWDMALTEEVMEKIMGGLVIPL